MARKRFQRGHIYLDGDKWKGRYREDVITLQGTKRIRREVILGTKLELPTKRLAERRMEVALARIKGLDYRPGRVVTFESKKLRLPPRGARHEARNFTVEQLRKILAIAAEPWRTLYCILILDGLRAGEALGLQWQDVDLNRKLLHIRRSAWYGQVQTTKSQTSETVVPIPDALATILKEYRSKWRPNPHGFLFVTRNGRPPSSNKVVEYHLWTILDALGIPRCGLHTFRHTHASLLLDCGATPKVAQRQLRHSDARTTLEIYGHVVGEAHREAVEKVATVVDAIGRQPMAVN